MLYEQGEDGYQNELVEDKSVNHVSFENSDEEAPELVKGVEVANGSEPKKPLNQQMHSQVNLMPPRKK